jgi:predicted N-formylglutamate amidohydrolase
MLFEKPSSNKNILETHRGLDLGALDFFNHLKPLADFTSFSKKSRLLIELNRSLHHKNLFSEFSNMISLSEKRELIDSYYVVYRNKVETAIQNYIETGNKVVHISVHSFTPILNDIQRNCDIGILYDSSLKSEKVFSHQLKTAILQQNKELNIRYNYPYLGKMDGFTTYLRKHFPKNYLGIELEINQKYTEENNIQVALQNVLFDAISVLKTNNF